MAMQIRIIIAAVAAAVLAGCGAVPAAGGHAGQSVVVTAERVAECREQGGCYLVSRLELLQALEEARQVGAGQGCRKDSAL
jgi:hypothetical protein